MTIEEKRQKVSEGLVVKVWKTGLRQYTVESGLVLLVSAEETPHGRKILTKLRQSDLITRASAPVGGRCQIELVTTRALNPEQVESIVRNAYVGNGSDVTIKFVGTRD